MPEIRQLGESSAANLFPQHEPPRQSTILSAVPFRDRQRDLQSIMKQLPEEVKPFYYARNALGVKTTRVDSLMIVLEYVSNENQINSASDVFTSLECMDNRVLRNLRSEFRLM